MAGPNKIPLTLHSVIFTKLNFETVFEFNPNEMAIRELKPLNNVAVQETPDRPNTIAVQMTTQINPERNKEEPYFIDVVCLALFNYEENTPVEELHRAATIIGHNVCYGAIREAVSWITGRLPYGPVGLGISVLQPTPNPESKTETK